MWSGIDWAIKPQCCWFRSQSTIGPVRVRLGDGLCDVFGNGCGAVQCHGSVEQFNAIVRCTHREGLMEMLLWEGILLSALGRRPAGAASCEK